MIWTTLGLALWAAACTPGPRPLDYGTDECDYCRMTLMDERHGGEIVTRTGKTYTFDSVECLVAYLQAGTVSHDRISSTLVVDYGTPRKLIPTSEARFLRSTQLLSPMGVNVTAFSREQDVQGARNVFGGEVVSWEEVQEIVRTEWTDRSPLHADSVLIEQ